MGEVSQRWLAEMGIYTTSDLEKAGVIPTYKLLKERYPKRVSLNLLWALEAALRDIDWHVLTKEDKEELQNQL